MVWNNNSTDLQPFTQNKTIKKNLNLVFFHGYWVHFSSKKLVKGQIFALQMLLSDLRSHAYFPLAACSFIRVATVIISSNKSLKNASGLSTSSVVSRRLTWTRFLEGYPVSVSTDWLFFFAKVDGIGVGISSGSLLESIFCNSLPSNF